MNKIIYWIGIYAVCAFVHDSIDYWSKEFDREFHKKKSQNEDKRNRSVNISEKKVGGPVNRIGF